MHLNHRNKIIKERIKSKAYILNSAIGNIKQCNITRTSICVARNLLNDDSNYEEAIILKNF